MLSPFSTSPNPGWLYLTPALHGALDKIRFAIAERQGLSVIMGDVGLGKSTVLRYMHAEYAAAGYTTTLLSCEDFPSPYAFLLRICRDFGQDPRPPLILDPRP